MGHKNKEIIALSLAIAIAVLLGLNTSRFFFRIDLTENRAFSLSSVSKTLFQEVLDQVIITYYVSDRLTTLYTFPMQIEDLLHEYAIYSRGKISVHVLDPNRSGETIVAERLGVFPYQIEVIEQQERSIVNVYSGLVIQYQDRYEAIPLAVEADSLEYELTSRIRKVVTNYQRTIGLLVGDYNRDSNKEYNSLIATLSKDFRVQDVEPGEEIPDDVDVLFVLGNYDLTDFDVFYIDQFIMNGGKALFCVEGVRIDLTRGMEAEELGRAPLLDMLSGYGIDVDRNYVLDAYCNNFRVPRRIGSDIVWEVIGKYPYWISVSEKFVNKNNPVTARFSGLDLYWVSPLEAENLDNVQAQILIQTTPDAWIMDEPFITHPREAGLELLKEHDTRGQYSIAIALSGSFTSYFKNRSIPSREGEELNRDEIREGGTHTRLIIIGDTDFASNLHQYTDATYNMNLLVNSAEWLSNSEDLLEIRTKAVRDMRLNKIQDSGNRLRTAIFTQFVSLAAVPLLILGFGIIRLIYRRRRSTRM